MIILEVSEKVKEEGPWWGEAAIGGGFLIVGALISLIAAGLVEFGKSRHELARRFDSEIREAGATYLNKADAWREAEKELQTLEAKHAAALRSTSGKLAKIESHVIQAAKDASKKAQDEAHKALDPLSFVAPDKLIGAARKHYVEILSSSIYDDVRKDARGKTISAARQEVVDQVRMTIKLPASKIGKKRWYQKLGFWQKEKGQSRNELKKTTNDGGLIAVGAVLLLLLVGWLDRIFC